MIGYKNDLNVYCTKCGNHIQPYFLCPCSGIDVNKLQAENKRLREALEKIKENGRYSNVITTAHLIARQALKETKDK